MPPGELNRPRSEEQLATKKLRETRGSVGLRAIQRSFAAAYSVVGLLFVLCALVLVFFAAVEMWNGIVWLDTPTLRDRFNSILEAIGLLTIAVAALELGQTVLEEEVWREAQMSAPTRVRRFLSRFLIVVVVALSVETLVAVFRFAHESPERLPQAAAIGIAAAALLSAWGLFVKLNRSAEELEPEAMERAKQEDKRLD